MAPEREEQEEPEAKFLPAPSLVGALRDRLGRHWLSELGPGLITGVADDDPSGIATYSQAGAQYGLGLLWTMPLAFPLMAAIQSICARIGRVTGQGLAANIKAHFPLPVLRAVVLLLLIANTLNIAADVAAMGEVGELVTGVNRHAMTLIFVVGTLGMQIFIPYHRYVRYLKWLTVSLIAYALVLFFVHVPWPQVALGSLWPTVKLDGPTATVIVGVFGTTISPYLFFWQASEEVEDMQTIHPGLPLVINPGSSRTELSRIKWDTWVGMFYSDISAWFIILATGVTLHIAGVRDIQTAAQAAQALEPLAGHFAFLLFAIGILGVGLIGVPVLAGSAGYAMAEAMNWEEGLERRATDARGFYGVIAVSVLLGLVVHYLPISPMKALFWSAVINGVIAVPLMAVIILLASRRRVMGDFIAPWTLQALAWIATAIMGVAAVRMLMP